MGAQRLRGLGLERIELKVATCVFATVAQGRRLLRGHPRTQATCTSA
jgi:hypothetical protein